MSTDPNTEEQLEDTTERRIRRDCSHRYFDGRSAVTQVKWSDKGFIGRCNLCGDVIEQ